MRHSSNVIIAGVCVALSGCAAEGLDEAGADEAADGTYAAESASEPTKRGQLVRLSCSARFEEPEGLAAWVRKYCQFLGKSSSDFVYAAHMGFWGEVSKLSNVYGPSRRVDTKRAFLVFNIPDRVNATNALYRNFSPCAEPYVLPAATQLRSDALRGASDHCERLIKQIPAVSCAELHGMAAVDPDGRKMKESVKKRLEKLNGPAFRKDCWNLIAVDPNWFAAASAHWKLW
jgi:hypothetical protein